MKDGIGKDYTREDHAPLANQLFSSYSKVQAARSLASVIGEEEISELDKKYLTFGNEFEKKFLSQAPNEARSMEYTLNLGWKLLSMLPREELDRLDEKLKTNYYDSQPRL
jgi:V/A-type H+-transporting ATPase subunit B